MRISRRVCFPIGAFDEKVVAHTVVLERSQGRGEVGGRFDVGVGTIHVEVESTVDIVVVVVFGKIGEEVTMRGG